MLQLHQKALAKAPSTHGLLFHAGQRYGAAGLPAACFLAILMQVAAPHSVSFAPIGKGSHNNPPSPERAACGPSMRRTIAVCLPPWPGAKRTRYAISATASPSVSIFSSYSGFGRERLGRGKARGVLAGRRVHVHNQDRLAGALGLRNVDALCHPLPMRFSRPPRP
jgi:hypothetical protein